MSEPGWPARLHCILHYARHAALIGLCEDDPGITTNVLTSEEEGVALAGIGRFPLLMLVTTHGKWAEFNPWQVPMGVKVERAGTPEALIEATEAAAASAFSADQQVSVLLSERLLGRKTW